MAEAPIAADQRWRLRGKKLKRRENETHYFGLAIFVLACSTCLTGITQKLIWSLNDEYKNRAPAGTLANCLGIFIVLFGMLVVYLATNIGYKRQEKH